MKTVIQRVSYATVKVEDKLIGKCNRGYMILLGVENGDEQADVKQLAAKISKLRVFEDEEGRMNKSIMDVGGDILLISQFTLLADCRKGNRPSFINAAPPETAKPLYENFIEELRLLGIPVQGGEFGADMKVELLNDGPVTILLDSRELRGENGSKSSKI
jgi:D-tyrosyl-tRNA(Tyr) deacylase